MGISRFKANVRFGLVIIILLGSNNVFAHNVLGGVYAIGAEVEGEVGFSNGDMAKSGTQVVVANASGTALLTTETDEEGFFTFAAPARIDLHIKVDLGAGHVFETVLEAEELPAELAAGIEEDASNPKRSLSNIATYSKSSVNDQEQLKQQALSSLIEKAVAKQIKPLRQELNAYKEQASFRDTLGGIGYIFGLCGLGIYFTQRKNNKTKR